MRAAVWNGPGAMSVGSAPDATCPVDGILLRVLACGICGTDVRVFVNGDRRITAPWVLGHEISGEVISIGEQAETEVAQAGIGIGDHVHCISTLWCGRCRMCKVVPTPTNDCVPRQTEPLHWLEGFLTGWRAMHVAR